MLAGQDNKTAEFRSIIEEMREEQLKQKAELTRLRMY